MADIIKFIFDKIALILIGLVITVAFTMFMIAFELGMVKIGAGFLFAVWFVIFFIALVMEKPLQNNYYLRCRYRYQAELVPEVLHSLFHDCSFDASQGFLKTEVEEMQIIRSGELFRSNNFVVGRSKGTAFSLAEVWIGDLRSSLSVPEEDYFFKGLVFDFDYPYYGDKRMDIIGKNYRFCPVELPEYEDEGSEYQELAHYAAIQTDDAAMVTDMISSDWVSFMITIEEQYYNMVLFSVQNGHLYVVIPDKLRLFTMQMKYGKGMRMDIEKEKDVLRKELAIVTDAVKLCPAYERMEWKEQAVKARRMPCEQDYLQMLKSEKPHGMAWVIMERIFLFFIAYVFLLLILLFFNVF